MTQGPGGVQFEDVRIGEGPVATRSCVARVELELRLHRGDVALARQVMEIDLSRRHTIAGVRSVIEGMAIGGQRSFIIPPHLGYGDRGVLGSVPPNALLTGEVTLLDISEAR